MKHLVRFELFETMQDAITREKQLKEWQRAWKVQLIEQNNPLWEDLAVTIMGLAPLRD